MSSVSLGLGLTNDCNLRCLHCYRPEPPARYLPFEDVRRACEALRPSGINLGTGENGLHPEFRAIVDWLIEHDFRVSLTSNGLSVSMLPDDVLQRLHDVEISIDFPDPTRFDAFRGDGALKLAVGALGRLRKLGVPTTILTVLMNVNYSEMRPLAQFAAEWGALLRVNVYQPVHRKPYAPSWEQFWVAIRSLADSARLVGCTEPVVAAAAQLPLEGLRCGKTSVRVTPSGDVLPCVYWPTAAGRVADLAADPEGVLSGQKFRHLALVPKFCVNCEFQNSCRGGCASRRLLAGDLDQVDPYCPKLGSVGRIAFQPSTGSTKRLHVGNVCTILCEPQRS